MTIGNPLSNSVPAIDSPGTGYAVAVNNLLNEIKTILESKVPFSSLEGTTLDMNNVPIIDINSLVMLDGGVEPSSTSEGKIVYANGEFWVVNSTGAIKITSGAGLNASGVGGIGGDYGGVNPAELVFVDAAKRYDFYDDFGSLQFAAIRSKFLSITSLTTSATYATLNYSGTSSVDFNLPETLPFSGFAPLTINDSGDIVANSISSKLSNDIWLEDGSRVREIGLQKTIGFRATMDDLLGTGSAYIATFGGGGYTGVTITAKGTGGGVGKLLDLPVCVVTKIEVKCLKSGFGAAYFELHNTSSIGTNSLLLTGTTNTSSGTTTLACPTTSIAINPYDTYTLKVFAGNNSDLFFSVTVTYNT